MNENTFSLSELELRALETLCTEVFATRELVDAVSFRVDHEEFVEVMGRLWRLRYIEEDNGAQTYSPTVLALRAIGNDECERILGIATAVMELMYENYKDKATRKEKLPLRTIAKQLWLDRQELDFALVLLRSALSLVLGGHTTNLRQEDAYILPAEAIIKYKSVDDLIAVQIGWRDQALNSNCEVPMLDGLRPATKPKTTVFDGELVQMLPSGYRQVLEELEVAIPNKLLCLAVMGLRTVLDMFACELLGGDNGTFQRKMSLLKEKNLLNDRQIRILDAALEVGNAAAHRAHVPTEEESRQVLLIVEHLLREHYLLAPNAQKLKASTPPRGK